MSFLKIVRTIDEVRRSMRFWDASAIIPLLANQSPRLRLLELLDQDAEILAWWGTTVEISSALARREREMQLSAEEVTGALAATRELAESWHEVMPSDAVRQTAERLLRVHSMRAADSLQLAAALIAADHDTTAFEIVCLDTRLSSAARREGFSVIDV